MPGRRERGGAGAGLRVRDEAGSVTPLEVLGNKFYAQARRASNVWPNTTSNAAKTTHLARRTVFSAPQHKTCCPKPWGRIQSRPLRGRGRSSRHKTYEHVAGAPQPSPDRRPRTPRCVECTSNAALQPMQALSGLRFRRSQQYQEKQRCCNSYTRHSLGARRTRGAAR